MTDRAVIYSKQTDDDELPVPVTVRIDWFPDGEINPCMYWTPDGACYQVRHIFERTPLAFLQDRGEGLRFKVRAEITETPEPFSEYQFTQYETCLYFADNWFYGKNFIDSRYGHSGKEYIPVTLDIFPDGGYELIYFWVRGTRYKVEKTITVEPRGSYYAGGVGVWHKVEARQINAADDEDPDPNKSNRRLAAIFFEINKWFVITKQ